MFADMLKMHFKFIVSCLCLTVPVTFAVTLAIDKVNIYMAKTITIGEKQYTVEQIQGLIQDAFKERDAANLLSSKLNEEKKELKSKNERLNSMLTERKHSVEYFNSSFVLDGIKTEVLTIRPIAIVENEKYISVPSLEILFRKKINVDLRNGVVSINEKIKKQGSNPALVKFIEKKPLMDTCAPYDYYNAEKIDSARWVKIAGKKYTDGFYLDASRAGAVLVNLNRNYSTMYFKVGLIHEKNNATMRSSYRSNASRYRTKLVVTLDDITVLDEELSLDSLSQTKKIPLNYAGTLKFELVGKTKGNGYGYFGFVDMTIEE